MSVEKYNMTNCIRKRIQCPSGGNPVIYRYRQVMTAFDCVCVCVCVCKTEKERGMVKEKDKTGHQGKYEELLYDFNTQ